jgi:hypothetical protein
MKELGLPLGFSNRTPYDVDVTGKIVVNRSHTSCGKKKKKRKPKNEVRIRATRFFLIEYTKKWDKIYQITTKLPNDHKIYQMAIIYSKGALNVPTFSFPRSSKIFQNWHFRFENKPSGNPGAD